jgi:hypothetical protein
MTTAKPRMAAVKISCPAPSKASERAAANAAMSDDQADEHAAVPGSC